MKTEQFNKSPWWEKAFILFLAGTIGPLYLATKRSIIHRDKTEREILRYFKVEVTSSLWSTKTKLIQRDKPLNEEQIDDIYGKRCLPITRLSQSI